MEPPVYHEISLGKPWTTGRTKQLPWQGFTAMFIAILAMIGAITVVASSDDVEIDTWPNRRYSIQPGVALAILSAIANMALRYSLSEGARFAWWNKALIGSTLEELHGYWSCGMSLKDSLLAGRSFNMVALASVLTSFVVADGPLLQRSVSVSTDVAFGNVSISAPVFSGPVPKGFSGLSMKSIYSIYMFNQDFSQVIRDYTTRKDMTLKAGCDGICHTELIAAGFDVSCSRQSESYNIIPNPAIPKKMEDTHGVGAISFSFDGMSDGGTIGPNVQYKGDPHCNGSFTMVKCTLRSGTITYPVTLQNDTITLDEEKMTNTTAQIYDPGIDADGMDVNPSTLGGFYAAMDQMFSSNIDLRFWSGIWAIEGQGVLTNTYISSDEYEYGNCTVAWSDPTPDILSTMRELMFRSALTLSNSSTIQNVDATRTYNRTTYQANNHFLIGALALMLANTVVIVPLFLGWWRMGRPLSMSPLELAKVFRSPLLAESGSNEDVDGLIRSAGRTQEGSVW